MKYIFLGIWKAIMLLYWLGICITFPIGYAMYIIWMLKFNFKWEDWSPSDKIWDSGWGGYYRDIPLETPRETFKYLLNIK